MRYSCENCFRAINPRNSGSLQVSDVVRCEECACLMHAECAKSTCSKCGSSKLRKAPKVYSSYRLDRRIPQTMIVADEPKKAIIKNQAPNEVKPKKVRQPLSNAAQICLVFTWIYLSILTLSIPLVVDLLRSRVSNPDFSVSFLVLPLCCLWIMWLILRQKRWLSFLLCTAITTCTLGWTASLSNIDPTLANGPLFACTTSFLLVTLLLTMRARVKIRHQLVDQVDNSRLRFKLSLALVGSIGIFCGAIIVWLGAYQLDRHFDISIRNVEVSNVSQLMTLLLHASGLAVTTFCVSYFMLSGRPGLRIFVSLVIVGLLAWRVQHISTQVESNDILVHLVNPFPSETQEESFESSDESKYEAHSDQEAVHERLFPTIARSSQELRNYAPAPWSEIENFESIPPYLQSEALRLSADWARFAFILMLVLLPLRILGYSLATVK